MKESKHQRETRNIELVETGNLAISIARLRKVPSDFQDRRWRRALVHAVQMVGTSDITVEAIRRALGLP